MEGAGGLKKRTALLPKGTLEPAPAQGVGWASMNTVDALVDFLNRIDVQGYKAYKGLLGTCSFPDFALQDRKAHVRTPVTRGSRMPTSA